VTPFACGSLRAAVGVSASDLPRHSPRLHAPLATVLPMPELAVGDAAPDLVLLDAEERPVFLSALWKQKPLALIFLRHFG
jgi:hypothetical protein